MTRDVDLDIMSVAFERTPVVRFPCCGVDLAMYHCGTLGDLVHWARQHVCDGRRRWAKRGGTDG